MQLKEFKAKADAHTFRSMTEDVRKRKAEEVAENDTLISIIRSAIKDAIYQGRFQCVVHVEEDSMNDVICWAESIGCTASTGLAGGTVVIRWN